MIFLNRPFFALVCLSIAKGAHAWNWSFDDDDTSFDDDPFFTDVDALFDAKTTTTSKPDGHTTTSAKPPLWLDRMRKQNDRMIGQTRQMEQELGMKDPADLFQHTAPEFDKFNSRFDSMKTMRDDFFEKNKYVKTLPETRQATRRAMKATFDTRTDTYRNLFKAHQGSHYDPSMTLAAIKREEDELLKNMKIYHDNDVPGTTNDDSLHSILPDVGRGLTRSSAGIDINTNVASSSDFDTLNIKFKDAADKFDSMQTNTSDLNVVVPSIDNDRQKAEALHKPSNKPSQKLSQKPSQKPSPSATESAAELIDKSLKNPKLQRKLSRVVKKHNKQEREKMEDKMLRETKKWWNGVHACLKKEEFFGGDVEMEPGQQKIVIKEDCIGAPDVDSYKCIRVVKENGKMKKEIDSYSCCVDKAKWNPDTKWCEKMPDRRRRRNKTNKD